MPPVLADRRQFQPDREHHPVFRGERRKANILSNIFKHMENLPESPEVGTLDTKDWRSLCCADPDGFSLVESLMAILLLALGFMFVGPMMVSAINSTTMSRSTDTAALAATNQLERLALQYRANENDADLTIGTHAPVQVEVANPTDSSKLNRYNVGWTVATVPDVRAGKQLRAVQVTVTVTPIGAGTTQNLKTGQNKVTNVTTIFSFKAP